MLPSTSIRIVAVHRNESGLPVGTKLGTDSRRKARRLKRIDSNRAITSPSKDRPWLFSIHGLRSGALSNPFLASPAQYPTDGRDSCPGTLPYLFASILSRVSGSEFVSQEPPATHVFHWTPLNLVCYIRQHVSGMTDISAEEENG